MIGRRGPPPPPVEEDEALRSFDDFELRLGDVLRGERATQGKSLLDVQRELKIKATYIAAIENADPSAFESPGFIAGYVRSYARYLQLDPEWAFETFCHESGFAPSSGMDPKGQGGLRGNAFGALSTPKKAVAVQPSAKSRDPFAEPSVSFAPKGEAFLSGVEPRAIGSSLVLLGLIGALGYGGYSVLQQVQRVQVTPVDQAPGVVAQVDPLADAPVFADAGPGASAGVTRSAPDALERLYRPQALETPLMVPRDGPISAIDPSTTGALAGDAEAERLAAAAEQEAAPTGVTVLAVRSAWISIEDGEVPIFEQTMNPGDSYTLPADAVSPEMIVGASGGVYFIVDGKVRGPAGPAGTVTDNIALTGEALEERYRLADVAIDPELQAYLDQNTGPEAPTLVASVPDFGLPKVTEDGEPIVELVAVAEVWLRVKAADGSVIKEATLQKGDRLEIPATAANPTLHVGNAGAVYFLVNGQTYGPAGDRGSVDRNLDVAADAVAANFAVADLEENTALREVLVAESSQ